MINVADVPSPKGKSLERWQEEVTDFLRSLRAEYQVVRPLQLAHKLGDESAAVAGVLMYDPATGYVVVSDGTQYRNLDFAP